MIFEFIKIVALIFSVSLRSANISEIPFDFEGAMGIEGKYNNSTMMYERENGKYYYNFDTDYDYKYVRFTNYKKTAKNIDNQKLSVIYPLDKFRLGLSCGTERWENPQLLATVLWKNEYINIDYSRGITGESIEMELKHKVRINEYFSLVPLVLVKKFNDNTFWQTKVSIEFRRK